jgi:MFS family permease
MHGSSSTSLWGIPHGILTKSSAFLLAFASSTPLYGKLADTLGRKVVFYPAMFVFLVSTSK